jgi:hypothetical protein
LYWLSIQTNQGKVFKQMELLPWSIYSEVSFCVGV